MLVESIEIPAERVPPVAKDTASSAKSIAAVLFFVAAIFAIAALGSVGDDMEPDEGSAHAAGRVVGALLFAGIPALVAYRFARNASRATRAAATAASGASYTWRLSGKQIIAADAAGVPSFDRSFKVSRKNRTMLLALPRAEVRELS